MCAALVLGAAESPSSVWVQEGGASGKERPAYALTLRPTVLAYEAGGDRFRQFRLDVAPGKKVQIQLQGKNQQGFRVCLVNAQGRQVRGIRGLTFHNLGEKVASVFFLVAWKEESGVPGYQVAARLLE